MFDVWVAYTQGSGFNCSNFVAYLLFLFVRCYMEQLVQWMIVWIM